MSVKIIDAFLPISKKVRTGTTHSKKWIVIHETGNTSKGANAKSHSEYLESLTKSQDKWLSWHYTVDDKEIYHHIPDNEVAWHATDGTVENGGNMSGIGIEICINSDGNFDRARDNAAWLTAKLLKENGWTIDRVKQHNDFKSSTYPQGKNCPQLIRKRGLWSDFIATVTNYLKQLKGSQNANSSVSNVVKIKKSVTEIANEVISGKWGNGDIRKKNLTNAGYDYATVQKEVNRLLKSNATVNYYPKYTGKSLSIVDALASLKIDWSFTNRLKIAKANSVANYTGSAVQNTKLLNLLKQGKLIKP